MIEEELSKIGIKNTESKVYITLQKFGKLTTSDISKKTGIHRTYIYDILDKLMEKGLVGECKERNKMYFTATDTKRLRTYIEEKLEIVDSIIPSIEKIRQKSNDELKVEVFKGLEGVKTILSDLVEEAEDFYAIGASFKFDDELPYFMKKILRDINYLKIKSQIIQPEGEKIEFLKNGTYRTLPSEIIDIQSMIIYGKKVAFIIWEPVPTQILITSKEISKSKLKQFKLLWNLASKQLVTGNKI